MERGETEGEGVGGRREREHRGVVKGRWKRKNGGGGGGGGGGGEEGFSLVVVILKELLQLVNVANMHQVLLNGLLRNQTICVQAFQLIHTNQHSHVHHKIWSCDSWKFNSTPSCSRRVEPKHMLRNSDTFAKRLYNSTTQI